MGEVDGATFYNQITAAFEMVIHWKPNLFIPPNGSTGDMFVHELAKLFQAFGDWSNLSSIVFKSATVQQQLLLQKPSRSSKSKDHIRHLQRHLNLWQKGDVDILLHEGQSIQSRLKPKSGTSNAESSDILIKKTSTLGLIHQKMFLSQIKQVFPMRSSLIA